MTVWLVVSMNVLDEMRGTFFPRTVITDVVFHKLGSSSIINYNKFTSPYKFTQIGHALPLESPHKSTQRGHGLPLGSPYKFTQTGYGLPLETPYKFTLTERGMESLMKLHINLH